jgi:hypothetical protein
MVNETPIQPGQVTIDAVLVGGPNDMLPSRRIIHGIASGDAKIKVPHRGGYEHFVCGAIDTIPSSTQESALISGSVPTVTVTYQWSARTEVAE